LGKIPVPVVIVLVIIALAVLAFSVRKSVTTSAENAPTPTAPPAEAMREYANQVAKTRQGGMGGAGGMIPGGPPSGGMPQGAMPQGGTSGGQ